jgi:curved DNA-binding protein CbpA
MYDGSLLSRLGLPPDASIDLIKNRFRELVKKHHPDTGGDSSAFIELLEIYKKLTGID